MKGILYVLFGGIVLGCSDRYLDDESLNTVKSEQVEAIRLADLSQTGIYGINGFIKQGNRLIVGPTYMQEGVAHTIDLEHPAGKVLSSKAVVSSKPFRTLSAFNSWDGKSVTALDFKTGELIENAVSPLTRGITETSVIQLPRGEQHLIAVKTNDFVISTGFYGEGRYLFTLWWMVLSVTVCLIRTVRTIPFYRRKRKECCMPVVFYGFVPTGKLSCVRICIAG